MWIFWPQKGEFTRSLDLKPERQSDKLAVASLPAGNQATVQCARRENSAGFKLDGNVLRRTDPRRRARSAVLIKYRSDVPLI